MLRLSQKKQSGYSDFDVSGQTEVLRNVTTLLGGLVGDHSNLYVKRLENGTVDWQRLIRDVKSQGALKPAQLRIENESVLKYTVFALRLLTGDECFVMEAWNEVRLIPISPIFLNLFGTALVIFRRVVIGRFPHLKERPLQLTESDFVGLDVQRGNKKSIAEARKTLFTTAFVDPMKSLYNDSMRYLEAPDISKWRQHIRKSTSSEPLHIQELRHNASVGASELGISTMPEIIRQIVDKNLDLTAENVANGKGFQMSDSNAHFTVLENLLTAVENALPNYGFAKAEFKLNEPKRAGFLKSQDHIPLYEKYIIENGVIGYRATNDFFTEYDGLKQHPTGDGYYRFDNPNRPTTLENATMALKNTAFIRGLQKVAYAGAKPLQKLADLSGDMIRDV